MTAVLRPFGEPPVAIEVAAALTRGGSVFELAYRIDGRVEDLRVPGRGPAPRRADELWRHTCFEAFVSVPGSAVYWELNLAPSGEWNVYRFEAYRTGQTAPEVEPPFDLERGRHADGIDFRARWALPFELREAPALDVGLTAVIEHADETKTYWALAHLGPEPDFHLRESFCLRI